MVRRLIMTTSAFAPAREPAQIGAAERVCAADGGGVENIRRARARSISVDQTRNQRCVTHLGDDIERISIGSQANSHARCQILIEGFHGEGHLGALVRAVTDGRAGLGENLQLVAARIVDPRVAAGDRHVAEGRARSEDARVGEILGYGFAILVQDLQELTKIAAGVNMDRHVQFFRGGDAFFEQRRLAGLGLRRIENTLQAAVVRAVEFLDEVDRDFQTRTSLVGALFVVVPTLGVGENIMAAKRRAEKNPPAGLADDRNVIVQRARSPAGIQAPWSRRFAARCRARIFAPWRRPAAAGGSTFSLSGAPKTNQLAAR